MQTSHQQNRTPVGVYFVNYYVYLSLALSVCRQCKVYDFRFL